ncbi:MAG: tryptophan--tRNA ligase [Lachnospiraceae bacterium]|nr:tryptophan--tRNA ligase [Lachnospiraceae bacterium]
MRKIILTGDRPTGRLHIGHYVGSLRRRVELQNSGEFDEINIMIADAQALTDNFDNPGKVRENIMEVAIDYLSCGIDPEKTTILIQSQIPELTELTFYYADLVTVARLQRNPTVKTEVGMRGFGASIPVGFFTYPISQAADITAFKATTVPAGEDQEPMIEQTREIARSFNRIYGCDTLVEPEIMLPPNQASMRLPGTDGKEKMSKSLGNCIYLSDPAAEVKKKVMSMYTDPDHLRVEDPGKLEGNTVFTYLDAFCKDEYFAEYAPEYANLQEMKDHYTRGGLGDVKVKKFLNNVLQETLEPIRQKRAELEKNIPYVYEVLRKGTEAAEEKAARTLDEVRHDMMIDYFSGDEWLVSQEKKFAEQRAAADAADVRVKRQRAAEARKKAKAGAGQN